MTELIAVRVPDVHDQLAAMRHVWAQGDAVLPLPVHATDAAVAATLRSMRPHGLVVPRPDGVVRVRRLADGTDVADGTAVVVMTSGSSGRPKGVVLSHAALAASTRASIARLGCRPGERWLLCLPLDHVAGIQVVLRSEALGAEPIVVDGFDVDAVGAAIDRGDVGHVSLVPTQLVRLLDAGVDLSGLHGVLLGGAPPSPALLDRARAGGVTVTVSYGMTETCGGCVYDARPLDGVAVETTADGLLRVAGPVLTDGYRGDVGAGDRSVRTPDGWFVTSDRGEVDASGRVVVSGRADDVAITGGENVPLGPVRTAVEALDAVRESTVIARPDDEWGEVLVAVVAPHDGVDVDLDGLREALRGTLPRHALPRRLVLVDALPRTSLDKVDATAVHRLVDEA